MVKNGPYKAWFVIVGRDATVRLVELFHESRKLEKGDSPDADTGSLLIGGSCHGRRFRDCSVGSS